MAGRIGAGELSRRVVFDSPSTDEEGVVDGWTPAVLHAWARFRYLRGGETVQAARLDGRQPVVVTIRATETARTITSDWRMRDEDDMVYNVRTAIPSDDRAWVELTVESGVAT